MLTPEIRRTTGQNALECRQRHYWRWKSQEYFTRFVTMKMKQDELEKSNIQPGKYSEKELTKLRDFINVLKKDEDRSALACWGDHHDYSHGY